MRVLVVSNMAPDSAHPERGQFVRDQVRALRTATDLEVELQELAPGARALSRGFAELRRASRGARFDVVHAHFSLTALPALAVPARVRGLTLHGTDVHHPRTRLITRAVLPWMDLVVAVSDRLATELPGRRARRRAQVIPCGVDVDRFRPISRTQARSALGLDPAAPLLLFPADPARPEKRHDLADELAHAVGVPLMSLGGVEPERVPLFVNAANAVLVPSVAEGFGLAVIEALACDVPVLASPVGIHPTALVGIDGTLCAAFDLLAWQRALAPHLAQSDPRVQGRARALEYSSARMAARLVAAWRGAMSASRNGEADNWNG